MENYYSEEDIICGNCWHHRPVWENGDLTGWYCSNHMADVYGCHTENTDCAGCADFESKR